MLHVDIVYLVCRGKEYDTIHLIVEFTTKTTNNQSINPIKIEKTGGRLSKIIKIILMNSIIEDYEM